MAEGGNGKSNIWLPTAVGVLTFLSAGLGVWVNRLDDTDRALADRVTKNAEQHARIEERVEGQAQMLARLRQQLTELDGTLQREMRILDETAATRVNEMDRRLQQEMRLLLEKLQEQFRSIEREVFGGGE